MLCWACLSSSKVVATVLTLGAAVCLNCLTVEQGNCHGWSNLPNFYHYLTRDEDFHGIKNNLELYTRRLLEISREKNLQKPSKYGRYRKSFLKPKDSGSKSILLYLSSDQQILVGLILSDISTN